MRALTLTLGRPDSDHVAYRLFDADTPVQREEIHQLNVLADGSVVLLGRMRGDVEAARRLLAAEPDVLGSSISPIDPGVPDTDAADPVEVGSAAGTDAGAGEGQRALAYIHARPPAELERFLELPRTHEVVVEFPIEGTADGRLRVVMVGETNAALEAALADIPAALDVAVERIGPYTAGDDAVAAELTARQREVLAVARDLGYYEVPRQATHADIADDLGVSVGTVGEHLQKIESRVLGDRGV